MNHCSCHQIPYTPRVSYLKELLYSYKDIAILNYFRIRPLIIFLTFQLLCCFDFHLNYPCPSSVICGFIFFMTIVASMKKRSLLPALCIFTLTQAVTALRHYILPFLSTYSIYFIIILNYFCSLHSKS